MLQAIEKKTQWKSRLQSICPCSFRLLLGWQGKLSQNDRSQGICCRLAGSDVNCLASQCGAFSCCLQVVLFPSVLWVLQTGNDQNNLVFQEMFQVRHCISVHIGAVFHWRISTWALQAVPLSITEGETEAQGGWDYVGFLEKVVWVVAPSVWQNE